MDEKKMRFKKVAVNRTNTILKQIHLLGNCANKNNYSYSDSDVRKIFNAIDNELKICKSKFRSNKKTKIDFEL